MKKLFICSDLHVDFHRDGGKQLIKYLSYVDCDFFVIAGDMANDIKVMEKTLINICSAQKNVIFVCGNHDYFDSSIQYVNDFLSNLTVKNDNFHFLNNTKKIIDDVSFVGTTLWYSKNKETTNKKNQSMMVDFSSISNCDPTVFNEHNIAIDFLSKNVQSSDIVITHHMPTKHSVISKFVGSPINCYFYHDLDWFIDKAKPRIWIHGHTHVCMDYYLGDTRIVCNPLGYPHEYSDFSTEKIIEV